MSNSPPAELADTERDARLSPGGTAVMSFSETDTGPPHAVPVSYGYDPAETAFYFGLGVDFNSAKAAVLPCEVTVVVHGRDEGEWWSVVAKGTLEETPQTEISTETLRGIQNTHIDFGDLFSPRKKEMRFAFYRLEPNELTTRTERSSSRE